MLIISRERCIIYGLRNYTVYQIGPDDALTVDEMSRQREVQNVQPCELIAKADNKEHKA